MFFNESRWDAMNEYIKESNVETKRYVNKRFETLNEYLDGYRKETNRYIDESRKKTSKYVDDMIEIQQIAIDHLYKRIALLEKEVDELRKKVES